MADKPLPTLKKDFLDVILGIEAGLYSGVALGAVTGYGTFKATGNIFAAAAVGAVCGSLRAYGIYQHASTGSAYHSAQVKSKEENENGNQTTFPISPRRHTR